MIAREKYRIRPVEKLDTPMTSTATPPRAGTTSNGIAYTSLGSGPPVVWLRTAVATDRNPTGLGRLAEERSMLRPLADAFTVYALGRRPGLGKGATMADIAADHADALRELFDRPVPVLGLSTSGIAAQQLAADHPGVVARLAVMGTACRLGPLGRELTAAYADNVAAGRPCAAEPVLRPTVAARPLRLALARLMWLVEGAPDDPAGLAAMLRAEVAADLFDRLPDISAPTLVVAAKHDAFYPLDDARAICDRVPDSDVIVYPDCSHTAVLRDPRLMPALRGFLGAA
ncbi:alpha/beta fold hydrolase [Allonocardiopsis opalescens]|uniref:Pimeloyl-ACP methyl ester carboxylesterase n=1 Tax=Allonocardiopsis opalescens TaxID=1144618 RepID=A0A2T0PSD4_9ACTN|nr:alpha/beta hydrolase [Allonocardiopsis opalescens]PRX91728.1 pimeloyl-ACP methyl ester carboxylesterase [Allonocardiopsis opalescens]